MKKTVSLKISVSGVRGVVGESLTPQLVTSFAAAFGTYCGGGRILVGSDTRPSRVMLTQATIAGLLSVGATPVNVGVVPVPTLQLHTRATGASGGICITASHNPAEWNALKFLGADGIVLRPNQFAELLDLYHQGVYPRVSSDAIADLRSDGTASSLHREAILAGIDAERVRARRFKVVIDCCNGAASASAPVFLRELGCEVVELFADPNGVFPRPPEPLSENLGALCERVREVGADIGFALDADADRLAIVNEDGEPLGEECGVALAIRYALGRRKGPVVVNVSTSRMIDDIAAEYGVEIYRTRVGEVNVVERMLEVGAEIGGEGTGGIIAPQLNPCRDSFVGMAYVLESLAEEGISISELRGKLRSYVLLREKVRCRPREVAPILRLLRQVYADETIDRTDGLKVIWPDRWMSVRGSNTEPVMRVTAEAPSEGEARALIAGVLEYLRN